MMELQTILKEAGFTKEFIDHIEEYESRLKSNGLENSFPEVFRNELETVCYSDSLMLDVKNDLPVFSI